MRWRLSRRQGPASSPAGTSDTATAPAGASSPPALPVPGAWRGWGTLVAAGTLGVGMIVLPAATGRHPVLSLAVLGVLLVAASLTEPLRRWRGTGALAALLAVLVGAAARPGATILAVTGLAILGYLLLLDAPSKPHGRATSRWLRQQVPVAACGLAATAAVLILLKVPVPVSAWLVAAGSGAAVAAAALALPRRPRERP